MLAMVISTGTQVTVMKALTLKMFSLFKLVTVVKEPRKGLQTSGLFKSTGAKQKVEWIAFAKSLLYQEGPLQKNGPKCLESIINLHS